MVIIEIIIVFWKNICEVFVMFMKIGKYRLVLVVIILSFLTRGFFLATVFPIFKGQDESRHYNTVQYLAGADKCERTLKNKEEFDLYLKNEQKKDDLSTYRYSEEIKATAKNSQSTVIRGKYYEKFLFTDDLDGMGEREFKKRSFSKRQAVCPPDLATNFLAKDHLGIYHRAMAKVEQLLGQQNIFVRYYALRFLSVVLGCFILLFFYLMFREVGFSEKISLLLTAIVSFQPGFDIYLTNINYDVFLIFFWAIFIWEGLRVVKYGWSLKRILFLLIVGFLGILTKPTALALIPVFVYLLIQTWFTRASVKKLGKGWILPVSAIVLFGVGLTFFVSGKIGFDIKKNFSSLFLYLSKSLPKIDGSSRSYWGLIGWGQSNISLYFVWLIWLLEWLAWGGLLVFARLVLTKQKFSGKLNLVKDYAKAKWKIFLFLLVTILSLQVTVRWADWRVFVYGGKLLLGTPGRYWLPNMAVHFALLALGWQTVLLLLSQNKSEAKKWLEIFLLGLFFLLAVYWSYEVFAVIIPRFYF